MWKVGRDGRMHPVANRARREPPGVRIPHFPPVPGTSMSVTAPPLGKGKRASPMHGEPRERAIGAPEHPCSRPQKYGSLIPARTARHNPPFLYAAVAQWGEHGPSKAGAAGSSPVCRSTCGRVKAPVQEKRRAEHARSCPDKPVPHKKTTNLSGTIFYTITCLEESAGKS